MNTQIILKHANDLCKGDRLVIGKRPWKYMGRSADDFGMQGQNEYVFDLDDERDMCHPIDKRRVFTQSELDEFFDRGMRFQRISQAHLVISRKDGYVGFLSQ